MALRTTQAVRTRINRVNKKLVRNAKAFNKLVDEFATDLLPAEFLIFKRALALEALVRIVQKTPVDTGRARGNWQVGVGQIPTSVLERIDLTGQQVIGDEAEKINFNLADVFETVFIANSLDYIIFLEDGSSEKQAPRGMVALTIAELNAGFRDSR